MNRTILILLALSVSLYSGGNKSIVNIEATSDGLVEHDDYKNNKSFDDNQTTSLEDTMNSNIIQSELIQDSYIEDNSINTRNTSSIQPKLIQDSDIELDGDELNQNLFYIRVNDIVDLRGFSFQETSKCKSLLLSGVLEIKNKNLDYDKNQVFLRHGRITYVIPTNLSIVGKKCFVKKTMRGDIQNMNKLMKYIGK